MKKPFLGICLVVALLLLAWAMSAGVTARLFERLHHPVAGLYNPLLGV